MGFFSPAEPPFEYAEWRRRPHLERIKVLAQDWALNGFGTPYFVYLLYIVKLVLYAGGGLLLISATTKGLGGLGNLGDWWTEPIVFQKAVIWTMLWEVLGLGAGSLPLTLRFSPMIGGVLYWLRPGTTRLPPWPERVPLTRGTRRTLLDVALYAGLIAAALNLLLSDGAEITGAAAGRLDPVATVDDPLLLAILAVTCVGIPVLGNFRPDLVSFLPAMRYYAGNWATSQWLFRRDGGAEAKLDRELVKPAPIVTEQLAKFYDPELIDVLIHKGLAFRSMHSHGRALNGLVQRAVDDVESYDVREGELVAGVVLGYNFGDGHFHDQRLLAAIQERCRFEPGEVRVVVLESQAAHVQRQRYRIFDAATGLVEEGWVNVADMVERQPWLDGRPFPVETIGDAATGRAATAL